MADIIVIEKPDSISWDEIHNVIYRSHENNRSKGLFQATAEISGEEIREKIGNGKCFVAMDGEKVVGTCSVETRQPKKWFVKGKAAYYMFAGVIPEYQGKGIYSLLDGKRDKYVEDNGIDVIYMNTPEGNLRVQEQKIAKGYYLAGFFAPKNTDYYSVTLVKWKSAPPLWYIKFRFRFSKMKTLIRYRRKRIK